MLKKMKAVGLFQDLPITESTSLVDLELTIPVASCQDVLTEVIAVSVNPVDTKLRQNTAALTEARILGFDAVGEVVSVGEDVTKFAVGDRIYYAGSAQRQGSNAAYQLVDQRLASKAPHNISAAEAAAMPLTALTAYELLFEKIGFVAEANANSGQTLLVINGAGGVGSIAIQLAKWAGIEVIATCSPKNNDWVKKNGADAVIDYHDNMTEQLQKLGHESLEAIIILHSTERYFDEAAALIAPFGHIASIVEATDTLNMNVLKNKSASFDWEFMFAKANYSYKMETQGEILAFIAERLDSGELTSTLTQEMTNGINAKSLKEAHALLEKSQMVGKLVLTGGFVGEN